MEQVRELICERWFCNHHSLLPLIDRQNFLAKPCILLIEDNPDMQDWWSAFSNKWFRLECAEGRAIKGPALAHAGDPDPVLLD